VTVAGFMGADLAGNTGTDEAIIMKIKL